jgi:biopolymer transport protein ExbB
MGIQQQMWGYTFRDLFLRGGFVMYPLLVCSVVAACIALERILMLVLRSGSFNHLLKQLQGRLQRDTIDQTKGWLSNQRNPLAHVAYTYLDHRESDRELREEVVGREASRQLTLLERRTHWLAMIGHLAPMIGLLGTVWGLVDAFHEIESLGGQVQPGNLAAGIWKALLTTVFGLLVALPTLAIYHFLDNRCGTTTLQMQWLVAYLNEWFQAPGFSDRLQAKNQSVAAAEHSQEPVSIPADKNLPVVTPSSSGD